MKKTIVGLIMVSILGTILYFGTYVIQGQLIKKSFIKYYGLEDVKEHEKPYSFQRCNNNIFNPEFAYLTGKNMALMAFYKPKNIFTQSDKEWDSSYIGSTTIENTTFGELIEMVKDDCYQFQKGYTDYTGYEHLSEEEKSDQYYEITKKNLHWIFSGATPQPEELSDKSEAIRIKIINMSKYEMHELDSFKEIYGYIFEMTEEELIAMEKRIDKEGLDKRIEKELKGWRVYIDLLGLTDVENSKIINTYGEWKNLSNEELADLEDKILKDMEEGKFSLE